jgi:hypothetical protein
MQVDCLRKLDLAIADDLFVSPPLRRPPIECSANAAVSTKLFPPRLSMKRLAATAAFLVLHCVHALPARCEVVITGRLLHPRFAGSEEVVPMTAVYAFASIRAADQPSLGHRTWEMEPSGWYHFAGPAGRYTLVFSTPAHFMRPLIVSDVEVADGAKWDRILGPKFETLETPETLRGFVNIKGQVSNERPGFNPYRKVAPDAYDQGTAYCLGTEAVDLDLDMQVIEYQMGD